MSTAIPRELQDAKYISLTTFRRTGAPVATPVWFAEAGGRLCIFTNPKSGKVKRIRNNPRVKGAPCTMRGRVTGPEFAGKAHFLDGQERDRARQALERKYWLMRIPFLWSKDGVFVAIELD